MAVYRTVDVKRWSINARSFKANGHKLANDDSREIQFDMQIPYLYLPDVDFKNFAVALAIFDTSIKCSSKRNSCKYEKPCDQVNAKTWFLSLDMFDNYIINNYAIPSDNAFYVDGNLLGDPNTCYLPVFRSVKGD